MSLDIETLRHALRVAGDRRMTRVRLRQGGEEFRAEFGHYEPAEEPVEGVSGEPATNGKPSLELARVLAPVVGFLSEGEVKWESGTSVEKGQLIAEVHALGIANEVRADRDGTIVEWHTEPGASVEYGQTIATIGDPE